MKIQAFSPVTLLKRDSNTGVFLWILWNFSEHTSWKAFVKCWLSVLINNVTNKILSGHFLKKKKKKKHSKTLLDEKNFHDAFDHFVFLYFSGACQAALSLQKMIVVKDFKTA